VRTCAGDRHEPDVLGRVALHVGVGLRSGYLHGTPSTHGGTPSTHRGPLGTQSRPAQTTRRVLTEVPRVPTGGYASVRRRVLVEYPVSTPRVRRGVAVGVPCRMVKDALGEDTRSPHAGRGVLTWYAEYSRSTGANLQDGEAVLGEVDAHERLDRVPRLRNRDIPLRWVICRMAIHAMVCTHKHI
jgi:hypothetical protein